MAVIKSYTKTHNKK